MYVINDRQIAFCKTNRYCFVLIQLSHELLGVVGITLSHQIGEPKNKSLLADIQAAETFNQFNIGWYANPIFGNGDYPDVLKWQINNKSLEQGYNMSRLPVFTESEKEMLKGSSLFYLCQLLF